MKPYLPPLLGLTVFLLGATGITLYYRKRLLSMYYRIAILSLEGKWEWANNTLLFEHQVQPGIDYQLTHGIPDSRILVIEGATIDELGARLANVNAAGIGPLDLESPAAKERTNIPPAQPLRGQRLAPEPKPHKKTAQEEKMDARRLELEQSTGPAKNTRYYYQSPYDWKEYRRWIHLSQRVRAGDFAWEHNPDDPRNL